MNGEMRRCDFTDEQEKCPQYEPKKKASGNANLICLWFRKDFLDDNGTGSICTAPPKEKE